MEIINKINEFEQSLAKGNLPSPASIAVADLKELIRLAKLGIQQEEFDKKSIEQTKKSSSKKKNDEEEKGTLEMGNRK